MITRISSVIRPKGSDLIFDHPYNAEYALGRFGIGLGQSARRSPDSGCRKGRQRCPWSWAK